MIVMVANNCGVRVGHLAGRYPGRIGHLYSPGAQRGPFEFLPYALDNGRFGCFKNGTEWNEREWLNLLAWAQRSRQAPLWAVVPDVVGDRDATLRDWDRYYPVVRDHGFIPAIALQDGMMPDDVPYEAQVVFVGGSTRWKWRTLPMWTEHFQRVHIGRVNTFDRLVEAERCGVESGDGTGFTRGDQRQWRGLVAFLEGKHRLQMKLLEAS